MDFLHPQESAVTQTDSWRLFRIISEFVDGFETFSLPNPFISVFGSGKLSHHHPYYHFCYEISTKVAKKGFSIITGAGPSLMEAANKAAQDANQISAGLIPDVPNEPEPNTYIDTRFALRFRYFFVRKVMFVRYAQGFIFLPGGYGTLDELFEVLTLAQTKKIQKVPIFLAGKNTLHDHTFKEHCISKSDLQLITITDDSTEIAETLFDAYKKRKIHDLPEKF